MLEFREYQNLSDTIVFLISVGISIIYTYNNTSNIFGKMRGRQTDVKIFGLILHGVFFHAFYISWLVFDIFSPGTSSPCIMEANGEKTGRRCRVTTQFRGENTAGNV